MEVQNKRRSLAILLIIFCTTYVSAQELAPNSRASDEARIRATVQQMQDGWNTKSGELFAKPFAAEADYVVINGMQMKGQDEIGKEHQRIFETIYKDSTLTLKVQHIRFLRPDIAVVHVAGHNLIRRDSETIKGDAIITLVMSKEKNGWQIEAFHNTEVKTPPQR